MSGYPATAKEAVELNVKYYFTGKPCKRGHVVARYASNGTCTACDTTSVVKKVTPRKQAEDAGQSTYEGKPCSTCGGTTRSVTNRMCMHCKKHKMTPTEIKLMIIRWPNKDALWYAAKAHRKIRSIYDAFEALNIPRSKRPPHYVG